MVRRWSIVTTLSQHVLQHLEVERLVGDPTLELPVSSSSARSRFVLAHLHPAILPPPAVERLARDTVPADHLAARAWPLGFRRLATN